MIHFYTRCFLKLIELKIPSLASICLLYINYFFSGSEWFSGCWFARPSETIHDEGRLFFKNEVIAVYRNDETRKLCEIQRVCDVMPAKLYIKRMISLFII